MRRYNMKSKPHEIVKYWFSIVDECELSVDASEAHERCWRCGSQAPLERCHIIPAALGGEDKPSNLVLLCHRCHLESPNVSDPEIMWDWLRAYKTHIYDTFWIKQGMKEYKFIYGKSLTDELKDRKIDKKNMELIIRLLEEEIKKTSYHFGYPYHNTVTMAGVIRIVLKNYDSLRYKMKTSH